MRQHVSKTEATNRQPESSFEPPHSGADVRSPARLPAEPSDLRIELRPTASLTLRPTNPRTHTPKQVRQIADSIRTFGFTNPVLVDATGGVIAGHGRVLAARQLGLEAVPTIRLDHLTPEQLRAYVIADNRLAELAGWDQDLLALELQGLAEIDLDFDLTVTGFETAEIDLIIGGIDEDEPDAADQVPAVDPQTPAVSRPGDLWAIGRHRLLCGDATEAKSYARVLAGEPAQMVFTDPPYNVPIDGHVSGLGSVRHREFAMASGEMDEAAFTGFLSTVLGHLAANSLDGAIHYVCMDWRHVGELLAAGRSVYTELKNICVWRKTNGGMGSLYRSQHELVFVYKAGTAPHINNVELGRHGRNRTNVWDYPGVTSRSRWSPTRSSTARTATGSSSTPSPVPERPCWRPNGPGGSAGQSRSTRSTSTSPSAGSPTRPGSWRSTPRPAKASPSARRRRWLRPTPAPQTLRPTTRPTTRRKPPVNNNKTGAGKPAPDYEVGYKKPPTHTRFRKGRSGNPKGRPKGSRNLKADLEEELRERITVREGDRTRTFSKQRALVKAMLTRALKGDAKATGHILSTMLRVLDLGDEAATEVPPLDDDEAAIIAAFTERTRRSGTEAVDDEPDAIEAT
jgi:hypothetical protein